MAKTITIKFREIEVRELLRLVNENIKSGEYWAPKEQYYKRMNDIKAKLEGKEEDEAYNIGAWIDQGT